MKVDLPVLSEKDINDVQNFCAKNKMDYIAVSFVQTGEDIKLVRKTLDDAGGQDTQIIAKIENQAGMENFDEILKETDGIMVARGDLGMEIPSEKVLLTQLNGSLAQNGCPLYAHFARISPELALAR